MLSLPGAAPFAVGVGVVSVEPVFAVFAVFAVAVVAVVAVVAAAAAEPVVALAEPPARGRAELASQLEQRLTVSRSCSCTIV